MCLEALSLCGTWALLVWGTAVQHMQLMQLIFGMQFGIFGIFTSSYSISFKTFAKAFLIVLTDEIITTFHSALFAMKFYLLVLHQIT